MNQTEKVKQFTQESMGLSVPNRPIPMSREQVVFVTRMVCEELMELLVTIKHDPNEDVKQLLVDIVNKSNLPQSLKTPSDEIGVIAEQIDAAVDCNYYFCNTFCKHGMNMDKVFDLVHQANMNKKFEDGTFHRDVHGKVQKPLGWVEPNVRGEVERWIKEGSWS